MKAFLSYSLNDEEAYIITLLAEKLQEQGFYATSGLFHQTISLDPETKADIQTAALFIGILTKQGDMNQRVYSEWKHAKQKNVPALLLIEHGVDIVPLTDSTPRIIYFNRNQPDIAINTIKKQIKKAKNVPQLTLDNTLTWLFGGLAILLVINLLTNQSTLQTQ